MTKRIKRSWKLRIKKNSNNIHRIKREILELDLIPRIRNIEDWINTFHPKRICKNFDDLLKLDEE